MQRAQRAEGLAHADRLERRRTHPGGWGWSGHGIASMKAVERRDGAEHAALHLDHLESGEMIAVVGRGAAILEQHTFEAAIVGFAHRRMNADIGRDAGQDDIVDAARPQHEFEIGGAERSLARLVDDRLARERPKLVDYLPARFAANEHLAAGARVADAGADPLRPPALVGGQIGEIGAMALARMDDVVALRPRCFEQRADRLDRRPGQRNVVSHRVDITALAAEIGLHVDDDDGGVLRPPVAVIRPGIGIGFERRQEAHPHFAIDNSPGMSRAECLALDVAIMMPRVRM